jgi:1-deoxy-D-xylulose-5-phosphate synthase
MAPSDEAELRNMLLTAIDTIDGPVCIRYPRGRGRGVPIDSPPSAMPLYRPRVVREGTKTAIVAAGHALEAAERVCDLLEPGRIHPTLVDARFVKPLDREFYRELLAGHSRVFTLEHNSLAGGFGSAVLELAAAEGARTPILPLGYPDRFVAHGTVDELLEEHGLTPERIAERIAASAKPGRSRRPRVLSGEV